MLHSFGFVLGCKATWKREFKLPWREAGPPNHHDDKVDSDQKIVNEELSLWAGAPGGVHAALARLCAWLRRP